MAVIQISRVQHRRGLLQDLPQLSAAEFGWVLDGRRLFIGNGPIEEGAPEIGNTEILTEYSNILGDITTYIYKGEDVGYIAQTTTGSGEIQRTLQSKLDDFVNARDFGIKGDGSTDDADAINWMLFQIYCREATNDKSKKVIYFPPGIYTIKSTLKIPSETAIVGAGADHTIFRYEGTVDDYVIRTADSAQQTGVNIGLGGAEVPQHIMINGCTFRTTAQHSIALVENAKYVHFDDVAFDGPHPNDNSVPSSIVDPTGAVTAVELKATSEASFHITFHRCDFERCEIGLGVADEISNIVIDKCNFHHLFHGIIAGNSISAGSNGPAGLKVTSSYFDKIFNTAIRTYTVQQFVSSFNTFTDAVATNDLGTGNPTAPVIEFYNDNNYSIGDSFARTATDAAVFPRIENNKKRVFGLVAGDFIGYGTHREEPGVEVVLLDNTSVNTETGIDFDESVVTHAMIDFAISRGTSLRIGKLMVSGSNTFGYTLDQEFTENTDPGVAFFIDQSSGKITYTTTSIGSDAVFSYRIRRFAQ
jgi:hypothetical protein